jgi:nicotinate-nucleotide--dimethylbenzimidazole phosphoribosyltransferase
VDAIDTVGWIRQAEELRDARRTIAGLRSRPDELLEALGSPTVAAAAGFALRAAARRTPVVLDGVAVLAAGLLCVDIQTRARHWWQVADTAPSRAHKRAVEELEMTPVLDLGTEFGDGTAGVLAIQVLRTAALTGAHDD